MKSSFPEPDYELMSADVVNRARLQDRRGLRRRLATAGAAVGLVGLSVIAATVVYYSQEDLRLSAYCYEGESLDSRSTTVRLIPSTGSTGDDAAGNPVELALANCAAVWDAGILGAGSPPTSIGTGYPVPELRACRGSDGLIAVFPSRDGTLTCGELGLDTV